MLKKVSRRLLIWVAVCLLAAGLCGIGLLYGQLSRISELDVLQSFRQAVEQTAINLSDRMSYAEETMRLLLYDVRMQDSVTRPEEEETLANQLQEIKDLREMVYQAENNYGITQVRLYLNDAKMLTREGINFFSLTQARSTPEYERLLASRGFLNWIGAHEVKTVYFHDTCITLGCLYRAYYAPEGRNWAIVLLDLSVDYFADILHSLNLPDESARVVLVDKQGDIMYGDADGHLLQATLAAEDAWGFFDTPDGEAMAYITQPLSSAEWSIVAYMPRGSLLNSHQTLRQALTLLLFGLTLLMLTLVGCVVYALYAHRVRSHIRAISESLKAAKEGYRPLPANRALSDLDQNIGELLETNKRLTEENYRAQLREREVTLQALQAQINPHFLYNTLDSINWMAIREGADNVSDVIATLAEYFRLSLSRGRSIVTLREDIEIAEKYLSLYRHRYDYEHRVEWAIDDSAMDCAIPKLTLQPLIENALQHGIFKRSDKLGGVIRITAGLQDDTMTLVIWDNGPGLSQPGSEMKGYGLTNVRERLDLYFGGKYTLAIANAPQGGAQVTIQMQVERLIPD